MLLFKHPHSPGLTQNKQGEGLSLRDHKLAHRRSTCQFYGHITPYKTFFISFTFLFPYGCYINFHQNITLNFKEFCVLGSLRSDAAKIIIHPILPSSPHPLLITVDAPTPVNFTKLVVSQNGIFSCEHWSRRRREEDSSPQCITPTSWVKLKWSTFISTFWWKLAKVGLTFN